MMAIRFNGDGKPERLVFVEVKSRPKALKGKSGLKEHVTGMEVYPDWLLPIRGRDAYHILDQYIQLGLVEKPSRLFVETEFEELPKESLLIFTGETVKALKNSHKKGGESWETSLEKQGYQLLDKGNVLSISLNGKREEPMAVYQKDFSLPKN